MPGVSRSRPLLPLPRALTPVRTAIALLLLFLTTLLPLPACPICLGIYSRPPSFAEHLIEATDIVVARRNAGQYLVDVRLRGESAKPGQLLSADITDSVPAVLLVSKDSGKTWTPLGPFTPHLRDFLRTVLSIRRFDAESNPEWRLQLARFRPFLGHPDPRIANSAWAAWAIAPYDIVRTYRPLPPNRDLRRWLKDETRAPEHSLYWSLLGMQAGEEDRKRIRSEILERWRENESSALAALLDADLSARGEESVPFIASHYFTNRDRTLDEIRAAVLALRMHGHAGEPALRPAIQRTFNSFLTQRRPLSGLVAEDFLKWNDASAVEHYRELLDSGDPVLPSTRPAIQRYLDTIQTDR